MPMSDQSNISRNSPRGKVAQTKGYVKNTAHGTKIK